ncbi:hypothetical protein Q3G72_018630 [Acer saccharum]|nr:hypothetical protein Q3G72_018630 [Acer saccharum]
MVDVIYEVRANLSTFDKLSIRYVPRDSNGVADGLAKRVFGCWCFCSVGFEVVVLLVWCGLAGVACAARFF